MNIHKYWDLIKRFEMSLLEKDSFYRHKLKRVNGEYVIPEIKLMFDEYKALNASVDVEIEKSEKIKEVIIPKLEEL